MSTEQIRALLLAKKAEFRSWERLAAVIDGVTAETLRLIGNGTTQKVTEETEEAITAALLKRPMAPGPAADVAKALRLTEQAAELLQRALRASEVSDPERDALIRKVADQVNAGLVPGATTPAASSPPRRRRSTG